MPNKICNFDVLLDDCFMHFNPNKANISPDDNDFLLSVANGFEDGQWMKKAFYKFIFDNIVETALSSDERDKCVNGEYSKLTEAVKHLRLTDNSNDIGKGSEIAEIVLYGIMKHYFHALSAIPKIFYKQNDNDNAKGADSVHIVLTDDGDFQLWLGEAKFYNNLEDSRFSVPIGSVQQMLQTPIIKKETGILTNLNELDKQIKDVNLVKKIKEALNPNQSIDLIKPKIHVPILLLYQCDITASTTEFTDDYKQKIIDYHKERAIVYFKKQISSLAGIYNYDKINFHLILFPIPNKEEIVSWFVDRAKIFRQDV